METCDKVTEVGNFAPVTEARSMPAMKDATINKASRIGGHEQVLFLARKVCTLCGKLLSCVLSGLRIAADRLWKGIAHDGIEARGLSLLRPHGAK